MNHTKITMVVAFWATYNSSSMKCERKNARRMKNSFYLTQELRLDYIQTLRFYRFSDKFVVTTDRSILYGKWETAYMKFGRNLTE